MPGALLFFLASPLIPFYPGFVNRGARSKNETDRADLRLRSIDDLFRAPNLSPLSEDYQLYNSMPGIEYLAKDLTARGKPRGLNLKLLLPASQIQPGLESEAESAVKRYCDSRIADIEQDLRILSEQVRQTLLWAVPGWFALLGLAQILSRVGEFEVDIVGQGLGVAAWVLLWFPLDAMIFGIRHKQAERGIYRRIREARLQVLPVESSSETDR